MAKTTNIINLNKFAPTCKVNIGDDTFTVRQISVRELMEREPLPEDATQLDHFNYNIDTIVKHSDIPKDVLLDVSMDILWYLVGMVSGTVKSEDDLEAMSKLGEAMAASKK